MSIETRRFIEQVFFFLILGGAGLLLWKIFAPFAGTLALAAVIVTICYPIQSKILKILPRKNKSLTAFLSLSFVIVIVVLPLSLLASLVSKEAVSIYSLLSSSSHSSFVNSILQLESLIQSVIPSFTIDMSAIIQQFASGIADSFFKIVASTATTIFLLFIALIGIYFFFKDGEYFVSYIIKLSPLNDKDDKKILNRLAVAVRSVALGTLTVAIIQGVLTAIGLSVFGFERYILWGSIAAIGALIPGIGTAIVFIPSVLFLLYQGQFLFAILLTIWGVLIVGLVDNIIGPKIMSKKNKMHPFLILISVLGGLLYFGPIGFFLGPVILSLFLVLLELYNSLVVDEL